MLAQSGNAWLEWIRDEDFIAVVFVVCVIALPILLGILTSYWHKSHKLEAATRLKQDMLARGFSPAEIVAVVEAGVASADSDEDDEEDEEEDEGDERQRGRRRRVSDDALTAR